MTNKNELLKQIPHADKVIKLGVDLDSGYQEHQSEYYRYEIAHAVKDVLAELREQIHRSEIDKVPDIEYLADKALYLAAERASGNIRRVINGTGIILHSNLGRACLSRAAAHVAVEAASSYCTLEYDVEKGQRGNRTGGVEMYLKEITGCEASLVVNNNAAAVLLILSAIASDGNVIVSRGELVEIGGGFRVPDIMAQCGCVLKEVGTTNKTRISDYESAIDGNTKAILKVHSSNFKIVGFTESVSIKDLALLGKERGIPVIEDIGSGALIDVQRYGLDEEPLAKESLNNGADVVSFSGDKLLGGLQCGIILGAKDYIVKMKKHPLYRAFRADKITIAILEQTLRVYGDTNAAVKRIPVLAMLSVTKEELKKRAEKICEEVKKLGGDAKIISTKSATGGGAVPGLELSSYAVVPTGKESTDKMDKILRYQQPPIIGHIENDMLLIDVRTIFEEDYEDLISSLAFITRQEPTY